MSKKILCLMLAVVLVCIIVTTASFADEYSITSAYEFPVTPKSEEWKNYPTRQARVEVCQIPENMLNKMTTEALLETVMNYPFLPDYLAHDDYMTAARKFENEFNGFRELFSREDLTEHLLEKYAQSELIDSQTNTGADDEVSYFDVPNLEFLIAYDQLKNGEYDSSESELFEKIYLEKCEGRKNSDFYSGEKGLFDRFI